MSLMPAYRTMVFWMMEHRKMICWIMKHRKRVCRRSVTKMKVWLEKTPVKVRSAGKVRLRSYLRIR